MNTSNIFLYFIVHIYVYCTVCLLCLIITVYQFRALFTVLELSMADVCPPKVLFVLSVYQFSVLYWAYSWYHRFPIKTLRPDENSTTKKLLFLLNRYFWKWKLMSYDVSIAVGIRRKSLLSKPRTTAHEIKHMAEYVLVNLICIE